MPNEQASVCWGGVLPSTPGRGVRSARFASSSLPSDRCAGRPWSPPASGRLSASSSSPVRATLIRQVLHQNLERVIDAFREWDVDGTGTIERNEFRRAVGSLRLFPSSRTEVFVPPNIELGRLLLLCTPADQLPCPTQAYVCSTPCVSLSVHGRCRCVTEWVSLANVSAAQRSIRLFR